jgi:nicotine blue oxidoreductase
MENRVGGVLLAAGEGKRLGTPKALVEVGGRRLVDRGVELLAEGGATPVVVVTGAVDVDVTGVITVHNPDWATGMGSSLRVGLAALPDDAGAVVISLVDQPQIGPDVVARLIAAHVAGATVAVATYAGKRRNPALFARSTWADAAATAVGDQGARGYFSAHPETVTAVPCDDLGDPVDIDTPADLARFTDEKGAE